MAYAPTYPIDTEAKQRPRLGMTVRDKLTVMSPIP